MPDKTIHEMIHDEVRELKQEFRDFRKELNGRVRKLEVWRGYLVGIGAAIATIVSVIIKLW